MAVWNALLTLAVVILAAATYVLERRRSAREDKAEKRADRLEALAKEAHRLAQEAHDLARESHELDERRDTFDREQAAETRQREEERSRPQLKVTPMGGWGGSSGLLSAQFSVSVTNIGHVTAPSVVVTAYDGDNVTSEAVAPIPIPAHDTKIVGLIVPNELRPDPSPPGLTFTRPIVVVAKDTATGETARWPPDDHSPEG